MEFFQSPHSPQNPVFTPIHPIHSRVTLFRRRKKHARGQGGKTCGMVFA